MHTKTLALFAVVALVGVAGCSCSDGTMMTGTDAGDGSSNADGSMSGDAGPRGDGAANTDGAATDGSASGDSATMPDSTCTGTCGGDAATPIDAAGMACSADQTCSSSPSTVGIGVCRAGVQSCVAGTLGACGGEVVPGGEACNGLDDDCDHSVDEGLPMIACGTGICARMAASCVNGAISTACTPGTGMANDSLCNMMDDDCDRLVDEDCTCVRVTTTGNDATGNGTSMPFRTIQAAINHAVATPAGPQIVCVAEGAACGASATYAADVVMANGVSVYGRYESTTWTRCTTGSTIITPTSALGVQFGSAINTATALGGFTVNRATASTTSAVTVDGATHVALVQITVNNTPTVTSSYGINLINGAAATITQCVIWGGFGTSESIGVRSVMSTPTITNNCASLDATGRCNQFCGPTNPAIRGGGQFTAGGPAGPGVGDSWAVLLDRSPGALVETTALCGNSGDRGATLRVIGDATGTIVRTSNMNAFGGSMDSHGIWLEDCGGAAPWIVSNHMIQATGTSQTTRVDGIRSIGDCHPVIDSNVSISGGGEGNTSNAIGVYCGINGTGTASRCAILDNAYIGGSSAGFPPSATGVRCDDGGCLRIERNHINGRGGDDSWGLWLGVTGTFVDRNWIAGGCSSNSATGIYSAGSFARIQNNFVHGYDGAVCTGNPLQLGAVHTSIGIDVVAFPSSNELDVNGNTFEAHPATNSAAGCSAIGLRLEAMMGTTPMAHGVYRNDIFHATGCTAAAAGGNFVVREEGASTDPRIFTYDDLDPSGSAVLYYDEGTTALSSAAMVNALTDAIFGNVLAADPMFVTYPTDLHIQAASMCDNAGTPTGTAGYDYDGDVRSTTTPDIGADER
jgi:hypothetical protein